MTDRYEEFKQKVQGTNIDSRSLLSTDYFNHFNTVIMLFGMLPEMPELLDEIDQWKFITYVQHFQESGLDFAPLAVECYDHVPAKVRQRFERKLEEVTNFVDMSRLALRRLKEEGDTGQFEDLARRASRDLQGRVDDAGAIVHGSDSALDQSSIDDLF